MLLYFQAKLAELQVSYLQFFEMAHMWRFNRAVLPQDDYIRFLTKGIIPKYAVEFLNDMQQKEAQCHSSYVPNVAERLSYEVSSASPQPSEPERLQSPKTAG